MIVQPRNSRKSTKSCKNSPKLLPYTQSNPQKHTTHFEISQTLSESRKRALKCSTKAFLVRYGVNLLMVRRHPRGIFDQIIGTFRQEEEGHSSEHVPLEIKSYLAERRIGRYYCKSAPLPIGSHGANSTVGEGIPFPGIHPMLRLRGTPQFGWNQETGEPWLAIKCYAREAFPALCGKFSSVFVLT